LSDPWGEKKLKNLPKKPKSRTDNGGGTLPRRRIKQQLQTPIRLSKKHARRAPLNTISGDAEGEKEGNWVKEENQTCIYRKHSRKRRWEGEG